MNEDGLVDNSASAGAAMLARLRVVEHSSPLIGRVDGKGLLLRLELVKDKRTRERRAKETCKGLFLKAMRKSLRAMAYASSVRLNPPLVLDQTTAMEGLDILEECLAKTERELSR
jgi:4-aminobutyrate aminotransferase-like enzyme